VNADYTTELYVNGISADTSSDTIIPTNLTSDIYIGANTAPDRYWDGLIDQVRFYTRPLTPTEITSLYNDGYKIELNETSAKGGGYIHGYTMDDISGSIVNDDIGSQNGTASDVTYLNGKVGDTGVFNGSSSKIDIGSPSDFSRTVKSANGCSYECWVYFNAWASGTPDIVLHDANGWDCAMGSLGTGIIYAQKYDGASRVVQSSGHSLDTWYHLVYNLYSNYSMELFIDGSSVGTNLGTDIPSDGGTHGMFLGRHYIAGWNSNVLIDQVRFYTRPLSSYEIINLYNKGNGC